jgi:arsenite oxidase small subunit
MSRRHFLLTGGLAVTVVALGGAAACAPAREAGGAATPLALLASYPRQKIGTLSALKTGVPTEFAYPYANVTNILVKLGVPAGGGVGPGGDVVAFTQQCTHMGGPMSGTFKAEHQVLGPCPLHLTTYDLTRHGMVVSGHGTESLPQIVLETQGDDIYAVGVLGLLYGYSSNLAPQRAI